jgi:hypothetical protein
MRYHADLRSYRGGRVAPIQEGAIEATTDPLIAQKPLANPLSTSSSTEEIPAEQLRLLRIACGRERGS